MENEVLFSLKPQIAELIEKKKKTHEFRKYQPKTTPTRLWFYVTSPVSELIYIANVLYIANVEPVVQYPDKISTISYGNEYFNKGLKKSKFAFPITHLYKLKQPLTLKTLKENYSFTAPQGFAYMSKYPKLNNAVIREMGIKQIF